MALSRPTESTSRIVSTVTLVNGHYLYNTAFSVSGYLIYKCTQKKDKHNISQTERQQYCYPQKAQLE